MNVLFPIGYIYPAENGGPALTIYWLAKALIKNNINVSIISTDNFTNNKIIPDTWLDTTFGKVIYLKTGDPNYSIRFILYTLRRIKKYDIIIITSVFAPSSIFFSLFAMIFKKKIIVSPRGELDSQALVYKTGFKRMILKIYNSLSEKYLTFHVTSNLEMSFLRKVIHNKFNVVLIPNYLNLPISIRHNPEKNYLLFVGRFHAKKAIENLILALSYSSIFKNSDFIFKLAGDYKNEYGSMILRLINDLNLQNKIFLIGEIKNMEKELIYTNAFFTIVPSHTENFCNVVIESLSHSTPVIASKGTPWKEISDNYIGKWVNNDPESLSKAIDEVIQMEKKEYLEMRKRSRIFIENNYDIEIGVLKWNELFNRILNFNHA